MRLLAACCITLIMFFGTSTGINGAMLPPGINRALDYNPVNKNDTIPNFGQETEERSKNTILIDAGSCFIYSYIYLCYERTILTRGMLDLVLRAGFGQGMYISSLAIFMDYGRAYVGDLGIVVGSHTLRTGLHLGVRVVPNYFFLDRSFFGGHFKLGYNWLPSIMLEERIHINNAVLIKLGTGFPETLNVGFGVMF